MSEFESLQNIKEEENLMSSSGDAGSMGLSSTGSSPAGLPKPGSIPANFDDFERLDDYPIQEQPEAEERETKVKRDPFGPVGSGGYMHEEPFDMGDVLRGPQSTDRPLMTATVAPEAAEIQLTPDPEESKVAEPFINVSADIPYPPKDVGGPDEDLYPSAPVADLLDFGIPSDDHHHLHQEEHYLGKVTEEIIKEHQEEHHEVYSREEIRLEQETMPAWQQRQQTPPPEDDDVGIMEPPAFKSGDYADPRVVAVCPPCPISPKVTAAVKSETTEEPESKQGQTCAFHPRAWFNSGQLDHRVAELIYWRDVKKSGIVFGTSMVVLLSLTYFSFISVVAYLLLAVMTGTLSYRIYKNVIQAVQKTGDGHPFKEYLEMDLSLPKDKVRDGAEVAVKHLECMTQKLRRLFLVEDLIDSLKFSVMLWCFTYIGSWFNGLTLFILAFVSLFTLPKIYETYQPQIDHYLGIVAVQVNDTMNKIKAKIPIGKKPKTQ